MPKKWRSDPAVRYERYHLEYAGFGECMKGYRARSFDMMESKDLINLPYCTVISFEQTQYMSWRDECSQMLHMRFRPAEDQYAHQRRKWF